jgi:CheY-like chemotaxis protein
MIARLMQAHEVTTVTSGEAALAALAADDQFDAILCDLMMPGMSGVELAEVVAERHGAARSRMAFLTSFPSTPAAKQFLSRSEARVLIKPVRYAQLATCVSEIVAAGRGSP